MAYQWGQVRYLLIRKGRQKEDRRQVATVRDDTDVSVKYVEARGDYLQDREEEAQAETPEDRITEEGAVDPDNRLPL